MRWKSVADGQPAPHAKYLVRRDGYVHTATPCYGMHAPWWVPMSILGSEYEPTDMLKTDEWCEMKEATKTEGPSDWIKRYDREAGGAGDAAWGGD